LTTDQKVWGSNPYACTKATPETRRESRRVFYLLRAPSLLRRLAANKKQASRSAPVSGVVDFGIVGFSERSELTP
ncbi:MAG: hypothetical protein ACKO6I_01865, partial [Sphingomonadales bacterium]